MKLDTAVLGSRRSVHFNRASAALDDVLRSDPRFASLFDELIPGTSSAVSRTGGRATVAATSGKQLFSRIGTSPIPTQRSPQISGWSWRQTLIPISRCSTASGPRVSCRRSVLLERMIVEVDPGLLNRELWRGTRR
jgi:hypothetical protein